MPGPSSDRPAAVARAAEWARRHPYRLIASLIIALAALLRFHGLARDAFWLDEAYSWWDARQSLSNLISVVAQCDPHPPLYFVLLKGWLDLFGDSVFSLRLPSALLGIVTTGFVMLAGREIAPRVGLLAGLLFALTPFQIEFSHEVRPYALLCFGAALVVFGALRVALHMARDGPPESEQPTVTALDGWRPNALGRGLLALGAGGVLMLWTNNTSVLFLSALGAAFLVLIVGQRTDRRFFKPLAIVFAVIVLLWLPNLPVLFEQAEEVTSDFWIVRPEGWRIANELRFLVSASVYGAVWWSVAMMAGALMLLRARGRGREALLLFSLIAVPVALNWGISMTVKPIYLARAMIAIAPGAAIALATAAILLPGAWLRRGAIAVLVVAHLLALDVWHDAYLGKERWDAIAGKVVAGAARLPSNGDAIVLVAANELALPLGHAFEDIHAPALEVRGVPADFPAPGLHARYLSGKCTPSVRDQDLSWIAHAIAGRRTVFFITRKDNTYDPGQRVAGYLRAQGLTETGYAIFVPGWIELHTFAAPPAAYSSVK